MSEKKCGWCNVVITDDKGEWWYSMSWVSADTGKVVEEPICEDCIQQEMHRECCLCGRSTISWDERLDDWLDSRDVCHELACFPGLSAEQRSMFVALLPEWSMSPADLIRAVCALDVCETPAPAHK